MAMLSKVPVGSPYQAYENMFGLGYFDRADDETVQQIAISNLTLDGSPASINILKRVVKEEGLLVKDLSPSVRQRAAQALTKIAAKARRPAVSLPPISPSVRLQRASELATIKHDYPKAIEQMQAVVRECPGSDLALAATFRIAHIQNYFLNHYDAAIKTYRSVIAARPKSAWAANALFDLGLAQLWGLQDQKAAAATFQKMLADFPAGDIAVQARRMLQLARTDYNKTFKYCQKGFPDLESLEACKPFTRLSDHASREHRTQAHFIIGERNFDLGRYQEAASNYGVVADLDKTSVRSGDALLFAGLSAFYSGDRAQALTLLLNAHSRIKGRSFWLHNVPFYTFKLEPKDAKDDFNFVFTFAGKYNYTSLTRAYIDLQVGNVYRNNDDGANALKFFKQAETVLRNPPYNLKKIILLGNAYLELLGPPADKTLALYQSIKTNDPDTRRTLAFEIANLQALSQNHSVLSAYADLIEQKADDEIGFQASLAYDHLLNSRLGEGYLNTSPKVASFFPIRQTGSQPRFIERRKLDRSFTAEVYRDDSGRKGNLLFLHGRPVTYVPGKVAATDWGLTAEYADGLRVEFHDPAVTLINNNYVHEALAEIPAGFFSAATIVFTSDNSFSAATDISSRGIDVKFILLAGQYNNRPDIEIFHEHADHIGTYAHELAHFFDRARAGAWHDPFNPMYLFRKINFYQLGSALVPKERSRADFFIPRKVKASPSFLSTEDFAYLAKYYFSAKGVRPLVREEMKRGNFRPTAKYLFMRYLTPFAGKEYGDSPSLGFDEVEAQLARQGKRVSTPTREVIAEIKRRWQNHSEFTCRDTINY